MLEKVCSSLRNKVVVLYGTSGNGKYAYDLLDRYCVNPHFFADTHSHGGHF